MVVTGLPCTGKTTLGRRLAADLGLPFANKDGIKEILFDELGWGGREWSRRLGRASTEILYAFADTCLRVGRSLVIESNFDPALASPRLNALKETHGAMLVVVHCRADGDALLKRAQDRAESDERHPGHLDRAYHLAGLESLVRSGADLRLEVGDLTVVVDTTDFDTVDCGAVVSAVRRGIARCSRRSSSAIRHDEPIVPRPDPAPV